VKAPDLARAYVNLDRFVLFRLQSVSSIEGYCAVVKLRLRESGALEDFQALCDAGAEGDELLWILKGCEGLPGLTRLNELFGRSALELRRDLAALEKAARVIDEIRVSPFGLLARHAASVRSSGLEKDLGDYVALAHAARSDFGHGSKWFLNIAKARLVIHVTHKTKRNHDKEISGLIAGITGTDYDATAQSQWRHAHVDLVRDTSLDPYTIMTPAGREDVGKSWDRIAAQDPEFFEGFRSYAADYAELAQSRHRPTKRQNHKK